MGRPVKMTARKLIDMISAGYGQGHGDAYRPFLKNTRAAISKKGTQSSGKLLYGLSRTCDFKSRQEKKIARALQWLGAADVREQFPIWPWPHSHPLVGAPGSERLILPNAPGLLEVAQQARIPHGCFVGTDLPYVATIDFMVTVYTNQVPRLVAIACKDREVVLDVDRLSRPLERLELERLYSARIQIPHFIVDDEVFGQILLANLEWLMPDEQAAAELHQDPYFFNFFDLINENIFQTAIDEVVANACELVGWPTSRGFSAFRYFAWLQVLDIDLSQPVLMTQPAPKGGAKVHHVLQHEIFGEIDHGRH